MRKLLICICILFTVNSCDRINENAAIDHISRTWTVYKFEIDGYDQTPLFTSQFTTYSLFCERSQDYTETYVEFGVTPVSINGVYIFSDGDDILTLSDEFQSRVYNVLTLTNNEMTLEDRNADNNEVYYLEAVL